MATASSSTSLFGSSGATVGVAREPQPMSGYLQKKGGGKMIGAGLKRRWFEAAANVLSYYKTQADEVPISEIRLADFQVRPVNNPKKKSNVYAFELVGEQRTYYLLASSAEELDGWLNTILAMKEYYVRLGEEQSKNVARATHLLDELKLTPEAKWTKEQKKAAAKAREILRLNGEAILVDQSRSRASTKVIIVESDEEKDESEPSPSPASPSAGRSPAATAPSIVPPPSPAGGTSAAFTAVDGNATPKAAASPSSSSSAQKSGSLTTTEAVPGSGVMTEPMKGMPARDSINGGVGAGGVGAGGGASELNDGQPTSRVVRADRRANSRGESSLGSLTSTKRQLAADKLVVDKPLKATGDSSSKAVVAVAAGTAGVAVVAASTGGGGKLDSEPKKDGETTAGSNLVKQRLNTPHKPRIPDSSGGEGAKDKDKDGENDKAKTGVSWLTDAQDNILLAVVEPLPDSEDDPLSATKLVVPAPSPLPLPQETSQGPKLRARVVAAMEAASQRRPTRTEVMRTALAGFQHWASGRNMGVVSLGLGLIGAPNGVLLPLVHLSKYQEIDDLLSDPVVDREAIVLETDPRTLYAAMHLAVLNRSAAMVTFLAARRVPVNAITKDNQTPLHLACLMGDSNIECVVELIACGANVRHYDNKGLTPETLARENGGIKAAATVRAHPLGESRDSPWNPRPNTDDVLMSALRRNDEGAVLAMLAGSYPGRKDAVDTSMYRLSHLLLAAYMGKEACVTALLAKGVDVSVTDTVGRSAMHIAVLHRCQSGVLTALSRSGISVDVLDRGRMTPLQWAAIGGSSELATTLLDLGADVNLDASGGGTALHHACRQGHADMVTVLLENLADVNAVNDRGHIALHLATLWGHKELIGHLVKSLSAFWLADREGRIPYDLAEQWDAYVLHTVTGATYVDASRLTPLPLIEPSLAAGGFALLEEFLLDWLTACLDLDAPLMDVGGPYSPFSSGALLHKLYAWMYPDDPPLPTSFVSEANVTVVLATLHRKGLRAMHSSHYWSGRLIAAGDVRATTMFLLAVFRFVNMKRPELKLLPVGIRFEVVTDAGPELRWFTMGRENMESPRLTLEVRGQEVARHLIVLDAETVFVVGSNEAALAEYTSSLKAATAMTLCVASDRHLSAVHFAIAYEPAFRQFMVRDLGSHNRTALAVRTVLMVDRLFEDVGEGLAVTHQAIIRAASVEAVAKEVTGVEAPASSVLGLKTIPSFGSSCVVRVVVGEGSPRKALFLTPSRPCVIGREPAVVPGQPAPVAPPEDGDVLQVLDPERVMSRRHVVITFSEQVGSFVVKDESSFGTFLCRQHNIPVVGVPFEWKDVAWEPLKKGECVSLRFGNGLRLGPTIAVLVEGDDSAVDTGPSVRSAVALAKSIEGVVGLRAGSGEAASVVQAYSIIKALGGPLKTRVYCEAVGLPFLSVPDDKWNLVTRYNVHVHWIKIVCVHVLMVEKASSPILVVMYNVRQYLLALHAKVSYIIVEKGLHDLALQYMWNRFELSDCENRRVELGSRLASLALVKKTGAANLPLSSLEAVIVAAMKEFASTPSSRA